MKKNILDQPYLTAKDISNITGVCIRKAREYVVDIQQEMRNKGYFVPETKEKVILTKIFKEKFGI